jgi:hypothetical protein
MERVIKSRKFVILLVCILWVFLFLFFLFVKFPYAAFIRLAEHKVEQGADIDLTIDGVSIRRDLSLSIDALDIKKIFNNDRAGIVLTDVSFKPSLGMLVGRTPVFRFSGKISRNGRIEGNYSGGEVANVEIQWDGVGMNDIQFPWPGGIPLLLDPTRGEATMNLINKDIATGSESLIVQLKGFGFPANDLKLSAVPLSSQEILYGKVSVSPAR